MALPEQVLRQFHSDPVLSRSPWVRSVLHSLTTCGLPWDYNCEVLWNALVLTTHDLVKAQKRVLELEWKTPSPYGASLGPVRFSEVLPTPRPQYQYQSPDWGPGTDPNPAIHKSFSISMKRIRELVGDSLSVGGEDEEVQPLIVEEKK